LKLLPAEAALCFMIGGALVGYVEFLRPGTVIAGVGGMVLLMLGVARVSALPWNPVGALLLAGGMAALLVWRGSWWGIPLLLLGARYLIGPEELRVRWPVAAGLTIPFGLLTAYLLSIAERARLNKSIL
jgi:membrane-bound serine protease (ClpP class)